MTNLFLLENIFCAHLVKVVILWYHFYTICSILSAKTMAFCVKYKNLKQTKVSQPARHIRWCKRPDVNSFLFPSINRKSYVCRGRLRRSVTTDIVLIKSMMNVTHWFKLRCVWGNIFRVFATWLLTYFLHTFFIF